MTKDGVTALVTKLIKTYPNTYGTYGRGDIEDLAATWAMALEDYEDDAVMQAFKAFLVSDQKGFPPAVGQIVARIPKKVTVDESFKVNEPRRLELKRSDEYFPGAIEVANPHTGEIHYVKYEGYPYGEGNKGMDNEYREEAILKWFEKLGENEQSVWEDRGALFGDKLKEWHRKTGGGKKKEDNDDSQRKQTA